MNNLFDVDGNIWIKKGNRAFMGTGRVELLENIQIHGSISGAAKEMKMSYKAAWDSVDIMNKLSNKPLVTKVTGGKGGGGTVITAYAKELIHAYKEVSFLHRNYFEKLSDTFNGNISETAFEEAVFSRLSGTIFKMENINDNFEISIKLKSGQKLTSIESKKFVLEKDLNNDDNINLLIETNSIILTKESIDNSARNILKGKVTSIQNDGINSNITIDCGDEDIIHSKITTSSCKRMHININDEVFAQFKAYNITIR